MNIGFKEWALVCGALESGQTSLLLRKGGIAEGREGFRFKHAAFFLFPTFFHEQTSKTTLPPGTALPPQTRGEIRLSSQAAVEWTRLVTDPALLEKLVPFHILQPSVVEERFRYDDAPGLHVAFLRVRKLAQPWRLPDAPRFGGCRSWLDLPAAPEMAEQTSLVLSDQEHARRSSELLALLGG